MVVMNGLDRFHLAEAAVARVPRLAPVAAAARERLRAQLAEHRAHVERAGEDLPEIRDWGWPYGTAARAGD
jgi:xylulose-5-phosphate/fructose-6-phosphate phosphoketolase